MILVLRQGCSYHIKLYHYHEYHAQNLLHFDNVIVEKTAIAFYRTGNNLISTKKIRHWRKDAILQGT